ncbi:tyrosine-type recombinase/integrase [Pandoraea sp. NPDC090278]|uniref:tyrosine-type recombinase/integrase n=1 Tax=Pandoraea sp. NPDC090278 TaxID=3364391 RepID=UPI00383A5996
MYLARCAVESRGVTDDTIRTYGESLLSWIEFLTRNGIEIDDANEEILQRFRSEQCGFGVPSKSALSTATANLRVAVVIQFYRWCGKNRHESLLATYLSDQTNRSRSLTPRVIRRHPKILSEEEIFALFRLVRPAYKLAFRWALVTGMRRFELASLKCSAMPKPEVLAFQSDGLAKISLTRKGGRELTVYAPVSLVEETNWHVLTERVRPRPGFEDHIFVGRYGFPLSRRALSAEYRRCADLIGSESTLHHLRHTYAVSVLRYLHGANLRNNGEPSNPLKTLQVLMGHSSSETTELYLRAMEVTSPDVVDALLHLYGASI